MHANEIKRECPVCKAMISIHGLNNHIAVMAYNEHKNFLQASKNHYEFKLKNHTNKNKYRQLVRSLPNAQKGL